MKPFSILTIVLLASLTLAEKQIKLEDIEKDTLKSAQQAKYEKQLQQYQQYQQYQPQQYQPQQYQPQQYQQYDPQIYSQQPQSYPQYSQYLVPQQYLQQPLFTAGNYGALSANSLGQGYSSPGVHPFQAYIGQQLAAGVAAGQPVAAPTQAQPIVMAISAPSLAALQHQAYYQAMIPKMLSSLQYYPQGSQQLYYSQQTQQEAAPTGPQAHPGVVYSSPQQYVPAFNPLSAASTKISPAFTSQAQYVSTAPQSFPSATYTGQSAYTPIYPSPTPYTPSQIYSGQDSPNFVSVKAAPQHLIASPGQHTQYLQATTISPLQTKYLNSPQYLAQNYNTIQNNQLAVKSAFPVGVKSTASPPLKIASTGGYLTSNPSSQGLAYQTYRSLQG